MHYGAASYLHIRLPLVQREQVESFFKSSNIWSVISAAEMNITDCSAFIRVNFCFRGDSVLILQLWVPGSRVLLSDGGF